MRARARVYGMNFGLPSIFFLFFFSFHDFSALSDVYDDDVDR